MIVALCPLCKRESSLKFQLVDTAFDAWNMAECPRCYSLFLAPQPTETELLKAYSGDYYGSEKQKFMTPVETVLRWFRQGRVRFVKRFLPQHGRVLDVGCGNGEFLEFLAAQGYECFGTELTGAALERARRVERISVYEGELLALKLPAGSFDAFVLWHVLEHLRNPREILQEIHRLLKPGGLLCLAFPNCRSLQSTIFGRFWFHLDPPRHLCLPSPEALANLCSELGFSSIFRAGLSLEQDVDGWLQSGLNCISGRRDRLYEVLKGTTRISPETLLHGLLVAIFVPVALLFMFVDDVFCGGGTVISVARRKCDRQSLVLANRCIPE